MNQKIEESIKKAKTMKHKFLEDCLKLVYPDENEYQKRLLEIQNSEDEKNEETSHNAKNTSIYKTDLPAIVIENVANTINAINNSIINNNNNTINSEHIKFIEDVDKSSADNQNSSSEFLDQNDGSDSKENHLLK